MEYSPEIFADTGGIQALFGSGTRKRRRGNMRVGINGFGRIGRAVYRVNLSKNVFDIPLVNDINSDMNNIAYLLNYDTTYGGLENKFVLNGTCIQNAKVSTALSCRPLIDEVDWNAFDVDVVIDSSGVKDNVLRARNVIEKNASVKKILITHSPDEVEYTMVIGANEKGLKPCHDVVSTSICDATAMAPVLKLIHENFSVLGTAVTTVHPLLSYQNVLDGACMSWSNPSHVYSHYPLGRSVFDNIIPKPTTSVEATCKVLGLDHAEIAQFSYRTPTTIVASADITLFLGENTTTDQVLGIFSEAERTQEHRIMHVSGEPLVSLDYKGSEYSAIIDSRWLRVTNGNVLKIILWYDNEWGYASRVCDQALLVEKMLENSRKV